MNNKLYLFLDVDGVLNNHQFFKEQYDNGEYDYEEKKLDKISVDFLNNLIDEYDIQVVITSTWKRSDRLMNILKENIHNIVGTTLSKPSEISYLRGNEILKYCLEHHLGENYIILDDDSDMLLWQKDNFIKTRFAYGLRDKEIQEKLINLIKKIKNQIDNVESTKTTNIG